MSVIILNIVGDEDINTSGSAGQLDREYVGNSGNGGDGGEQEDSDDEQEASSPNSWFV